MLQLWGEGTKFGRVTSTGYSGGDNVHPTVTGTKQTLGPLPAGVYSVESTVEMYIVNGTKAAIEAAALNAAALRIQGTHLPADTEAHPLMIGDSDGYLAWAKAADADDGELIITDRSRSFSVVL